MRLRDKIYVALAIVLGLLVTYYVVWPIVAFGLKWLFFIILTLVWMVPLGMWAYVQFYLYKSRREQRQHNL